MRVIYELTREDIREVLANKYEIKADKVEFCGIGEGLFARIDMSATETPELPVLEPEKDPEEPEQSTDAYDAYNDDMLAADLAAGKTVPGICKKYGFEKKAEYKLYKRAQRLRSEAASFGTGR